MIRNVIHVCDNQSQSARALRILLTLAEREVIESKYPGFDAFINDYE